MPRHSAGRDFKPRYEGIGGAHIPEINQESERRTPTSTDGKLPSNFQCGHE